LNESNTGQPPSMLVPPHNIDAEQAVLGALMLAPEKLTDLTLSDSDFYRRDHQLIFRAIQDTAERGHSFDPVTLGEWFDQQGQSEAVGHGAYLVELYSTTPSAANIDGYAEIVRTLSVKRQLIELGTDMVNRGFNCAEPAEIISDGMSALALVATRAAPSDTEPLDLFGDQPFPTLEKEWLPPTIATYAYDQAEIIGMAPEMIAMAALTAAAAACHDNIVLKPKGNEGWTVRACLWTMIIAPPGSTKSQAVKLPLRPLRAIEADMGSDYDSKMFEYEKASKVAKAKEKALIAAEAKGTQVGYEEPLQHPEKPPHKRVIVNDVTTEKLGELLVDNPRGLLYYSDEMAVWFGSHDAYAKGGTGKDRGYALRARDGGPETVDRIGRGTIRIPNFSYSLIGTTQPGKIREATAKMADDGLLQRFIVVEVPNKAHYGDEDRQENVVARKTYEKTIEGMWARVPPDGQQCVVTLSPEADAIRRDFHRWVVKVSSTEGLPDMFRASVSKWKSLWPELALTYHAYGCSGSGKWPSEMQVSRVTAQRVTSLLKRFLLPHALRFFTDTVAHADKGYAMAQKVASMVLARGLLRITNRELQRYVQPWKVASEWEKTAMINMLKEAGWLLGADTRRATGADSGWAVNPRVHILFGQRAAMERAKRAETAEAIQALRDAAAGRES
jgi:hypothetical protein